MFILGEGTDRRGHQPPGQWRHLLPLAQGPVKTLLLEGPPRAGQTRHCGRQFLRRRATAGHRGCKRCKSVVKLSLVGPPNLRIIRMAPSGYKQTSTMTTHWMVLSVSWPDRCDQFSFVRHGHQPAVVPLGYLHNRLILPQAATACAATTLTIAVMKLNSMRRGCLRAEEIRTCTNRSVYTEQSATKHSSPLLCQQNYGILIFEMITHGGYACGRACGWRPLNSCCVWASHRALRRAQQRGEKNPHHFNDTPIQAAVFRHSRTSSSATSCWPVAGRQPPSALASNGDQESWVN